SRVVAGFGVGAESAIIAPFLSEFVQKKYRGRFIGSLSGFFSFGFVFAALLGYFVVPRLNGWRIVQILTALPIVMLLWWRRALPGPLRGRIQRGPPAEAGAEVDRMEADALRGGHASLPPLESVEVASISRQRLASETALAQSMSQPTRSTLMDWLVGVA